MRHASGKREHKVERLLESTGVAKPLEITQIDFFQVDCTLAGREIPGICSAVSLFRIDYPHLGAGFGERERKGTSDESHATGDQYSCVFVGGKGRFHVRTLLGVS